MKVLHIVNWYPNPENTKEALFIQEHFKSLAEHTSNNNLMHIRVVEGPHWWHVEKYKVESTSQSIILKTRLAQSWKVQEILTLWMLRKYVIPQSSSYDVICFHVAYPLLVFPKVLQNWLKVPFCILEHWTAYHFNFNLPKGTKSLSPIRKIFAHKIPLITVSEALKKDIVGFSGHSDFESYVLPNVVDNKIFQLEKGNKSLVPTFFMVNLWRSIKSPFVVFEGFRLFLKDFPNAKLRVGGYGPLWPEMEQYVIDHRLENQIILLGKMDKGQIALEMNGCTAFVHASTYETFSVVTAEALMCGSPCIISDIPAIREYLDSKAGILVENLEPESWHRAMINFMSNHYDRKFIADKFTNKFSKEKIGKQFYEILNDVVNNSQN